VEIETRLLVRIARSLLSYPGPSPLLHARYLQLSVFTYQLKVERGATAVPTGSYRRLMRREQ